MKVLVIGGAGYVGHVLIPTLSKSGHEVIVADWLMFDEWPKGSSKNILVDIREQDNQEFLKILKESDCILHLASISNDPCSELDPDLTWSVNLGGTVNIVWNSVLQRHIYASSSSVYGVCEKIAAENDPVNPITRYSLSKVWAERAIIPTAPDSVVVRPATLMGYSPRMRFDLMVNSFVAQAAGEGVITVRGGGQYRSLLHIQDMVDFYQTLIEWPECIDCYPNIFNVSAISMTILEIAQLVSEHTGAEINLVSECTDHRSYRVNGTHAQEYFHWQPKYTVEDAIMEVLEAIHEGWVDPKDPRTINVEWMKRKGYGPPA